MRFSDIWRRHLALPADHGAWVFLLSPSIIGVVAGGGWRTETGYLMLASLAAFLLRQPSTIAVKALSGRRTRDDLPVALIWAGLYSAVAAIHVLGLVVRGLGFVLYLALPGIYVFVWHLVLVWRKKERQASIEILGAGVLALIAPAGLWTGLGSPVAVGWLLWGLLWAQAVGSILHVYLRLEQRGEQAGVTMRARLGRAAIPLAVTSLSLVGVAVLGRLELVPKWLFLAYGVQWGEVLAGIARPARGWIAREIGMRQLVVSALYTLIFSIAWWMG